MKEQEPQSPGLIEGLAIKSALWFEGKLDEWYLYPEQVSRWNRRMVITTAVAATTGVGVWSYYSFKQKDLTGFRLKPPEVKAGTLEGRLDYGQHVAQKNWILVNFAPGLVIRVLPELFDEIVEDKLVAAKLPEDVTVVTFLVKESLHQASTWVILFPRFINQTYPHK